MLCLTEGSLFFTVALRIDGTGHQTHRVCPVKAAIMTGQTWADILNIALAHFINKFRIRKQWSSQYHHVALSFLQCLGGKLRIAHAPGCQHRYLYNLLYLFGKWQIQAAILKEWRMCPVPCIIASGIHIQSIISGLGQYFGELQAFLNISSQLRIGFTRQDAMALRTDKALE